MPSPLRCLEDRERSALRIRHHGHAADIFNLNGRHVEFRAETLRLLCNRIAIRHLQIDLPVSGRSRVAKRGREDSPNELIVVEKMVVVVRLIFVFLAYAPSKKLLVETARGFLIGRAEVGDAKRSGNSFDPAPDVAFGLPRGKN